MSPSEFKLSNHFFRPSPPLALISGAGVAGLAASLELRARGFNVVIIEKRETFSRFNVINLSAEIQVFLKKFGLLERFEQFAAARIQEHRYVLIKKNKHTERLAVSDVNSLNYDPSISFELANIPKLFDRDGIYSVPIGVLQTFLASEALDAGVNLFGNTTPKILSRTREGGVSKVQIAADRILRPDLFFIAEGVHSITAPLLGIKTRLVKNMCTDENWIFGNMSYSGKDTFVVSVIDASEKTLGIANVIFNAKSGFINIAVTSGREAGQDRIKEQILGTVKQVLEQRAFPLQERPGELLITVPKPVRIVNRMLYPFSKGNVFCIGDAAGSSSPLAGLGGTLGLTLVPFTVQELLKDYENRSDKMHENFHALTTAYTSKWIEKSDSVKQFCVSRFNAERGGHSED